VKRFKGEFTGQIRKRWGPTKQPVRNSNVLCPAKNWQSTEPESERESTVKALSAAAQSEENENTSCEGGSKL